MRNIFILVNLVLQVLWIFLAIAIITIAIAIIVADGVGKIQLWRTYWCFVVILLLANPISFCLSILENKNIAGLVGVAIITAYFLVATYLLIQLHFFPDRKNRKGKERYIILHGAKTQLSICGLYIAVKLFLLIFGGYGIYSGSYAPIFAAYYPQEISIKGFASAPIIWDIVFVSFFVFFICVNAYARVLLMSKRLGFIRRVITCMGLFIPGINLYFIYRIYKISKDEYMIECDRAEFRKLHSEDNLCATKYPIVLVHGMAFRDFQYVNYWGRIPKILKLEGATVYYGHQAAVGTIENNAAHMKEIIEEILEQTDAEKVNIIAHSKGGLDARYMISELNMEDKIASLTTISTPHRGSGLVEILERFPDKMYRTFTNYVDKSYRRLGDLNPDCYHASKQLSQRYCKKFNEYYPNSKKVYYQSYACAMKLGISDAFFFLVHTLLKLFEKGPNDGLVSERSAQWGEYRGCLKNKKIRGISHGDVIDIRRDDILGFDVLETYIQMVKELKEMGY